MLFDASVNVKGDVHVSSLNEASLIGLDNFRIGENSMYGQRQVTLHVGPHEGLWSKQSRVYHWVTHRVKRGDCSFTRRRDAARGDRGWRTESIFTAAPGAV